MSFSDRGKGPPVVLVHGFPLDQSLWDSLAPLEDRLRLIRFDLPGFGGTAPPPRPALASYADAVLAAMDRAGQERAALCGLSMGGYILFEFWRRWPERVSSLLLCDTRAEADSDQTRQARQQGMELVRRGQRQELLQGYVPKLLAPASLSDRDLLQQLEAMGERASDAGLIAALQAMHDRPDSRSTLPSIRVPTLVLVGSQDLVTPPDCARLMQAEIPGSRLVELEGAGHLTPMERPEAFRAAVADFLLSPDVAGG